MFRDKNTGVLILNGRGLKIRIFKFWRRNPRTRRYSISAFYTNLQPILHVMHPGYAIYKATALKYKTRRRYKTKRLHTDFWPILYKY